MPAPTPYIYVIRDIVRIVDGDTFEITIDLGFSTFRKVTVRLSGLDTPECRGPQAPYGRLVKDWVTKWFRIGEKFIGIPPGYVLESTKLDKYGRVLGRVHRDNTVGGAQCLNDDLIIKCYALYYKGGNRVGTWTKDKLKYISDDLSPAL